MGLWSVYLTNLHDNFNHILSYMLLFLKLLLSLTLMNDTLTYDAAGFILDPYETIFEDPTYREIFINKIVQITSTGFTIDEFQKTMVLLCLIRFVIYSTFKTYSRRRTTFSTNCSRIGCTKDQYSYAK